VIYYTHNGTNEWETRFYVGTNWIHGNWIQPISGRFFSWFFVQDCLINYVIDYALTFML
jgi:hypothetical protein